MLHHFVTTNKTWFVVAYRRHDGQVNAVCECISGRMADQEAARLNYEQQGIDAAAMAKARAAYFRPRRAVRQFDADVFA